MLEDVVAVDPNFFCSMTESYLWADDKRYGSSFEALCNQYFSHDERLSDQGKLRFPTIYHLRKYLMQTDEQVDIRLVYLALHHMMKYRGHFLIEDKSLSAKNANSAAAIDVFLSALADYTSQRDIAFDTDGIDRNALRNQLEESTESRSARRDAIVSTLGLGKSYDKIAKALASAALGLQVKFSDIFDVEESGETKFYLSQDDKVEKFKNEILPEEDQPLFEALNGLYGAYLLAGLLKGTDSLSGAMVNLYESHKQDLKALKTLVRKYFPAEQLVNGETGEITSINHKYNEIFRGPRYADGEYVKKSSDKKHKPGLYTAYILGSLSYDDFTKGLKKEFENIAFDAEDAKIWKSFTKKMDDGVFLRKQRASQNGAIPHQLHLEEMHAIIEKQKPYYKTLQENGEKIESLLSFRIPYYVGPLGTSANEKRHFAWMTRNDGFENTPIKPWNFGEVVNKDQSAEDFIRNLTGECTYYLGKKVIPKNSLLYSEFCVRMELNNAKQAKDGERPSRMNTETTEAIINGVFKNSKKVKTKYVEEFLKSRGDFNCHIEGTQKENEFASSLTSYIDFKNILGREIESFADYEMVENLITWITVFEDKEILERRIKTEYGPTEFGGNGELTSAQIKKISKLRYTGWSNLSKEFLTDLRVEFEGRRVSIMDILRDSRKLTQMNLMEILADNRFGFKSLLEEKNREFLADKQGHLLEDIPGSPAIKRGINQSLLIIEEISHIAGKAPARICVEVAREEVGKGKGSRTKSRKKQLDEWYEAVSKDLVSDEERNTLKKDLSRHEAELDKERLYLYFLQCGKCMYTGNALKIEQLSDYHVDHIIPQSLVKNDSIDNKVLVIRDANEAKLDEYPLSEDVRRNNFRRWTSLHEAGLLSKRKYEALICSELRDNQFRGFINRQLVETRQITKHVVSLLESQYPDTVIETVKAELTHNLREQYGLHKSRLVNDYHHAHDAYLACQLSRYIRTCFPGIGRDLENDSYSHYAEIIRSAKTGSTGFIVGSFKKDREGILDRYTGEIMPSWNADEEISRIRTCLNYKDCFISRKTEMLTGEFWNQTVYSPRVVTDKTIPLKKRLDPKKYGFYMSPNSAYYSIIEHTEVSRGKEKRVVDVVGIPVDASYRIKDTKDLQAYLETKYAQPKILKERILKYQKIEWAGGEYYMTSNMELINARQLWLPTKWIQLAELIEKQEVSNDDNADMDSLFNFLHEQIALNYPRYSGVAKKIGDQGTIRRFYAMDSHSKAKVINDILALLHCNAAYGLGSLGLASALGRMCNVPIGSSINEITFVNTSVTGMFEYRTHSEL